MKWFLPSDPLLTAREAASYLKVSVTTLNKLRREGCFPSYLIGADRRYRVSDLINFINSKKQWTFELVGEHV